MLTDVSGPEGFLDGAVGTESGAWKGQKDRRAQGWGQ